MFKSVMNVVIFLAIAIFITACSSNAQARNTVFTEGWKQVGITSFYHRSLNGNKTANGERYRHYGEMTAAHRYLPFGTKIQVTDRDTGNSIVVRVNDRGPFVGGRVLDLSGKAADKLGITKKGLCKVEVKVLALPDKYIAKTKPQKVKKVLPTLDVENELKALNQTKPKVFSDNGIPADSIEAVISLNFN